MEEFLLLNNHKQSVQSHLSKNFNTATFQPKSDISLRYVVKNEDKSESALLVLGGYTEFIEKYGELFYDLRNSECAIYSFDHRGQGYSTRLLADSQKGHVESFDDFVDDLKLFLDKVVKKKRYKKLALVAHSMGAAVGCRLQQLYPDSFDAIVALAPMFSVNTSPFPSGVAFYVAKLAVALGQGKKYILGGATFRTNLPFKNNNLTSSKARFTINRNIVKEDKKLALGSPTFNWLHEAMAASSKIVSEAQLLTIPFLLLQSGDERVVGNDAQDMVASKVQQCEFHNFPQARHELLMEQDQIRNKVLALMDNFLQRQSVTLNLDCKS